MKIAVLGSGSRGNAVALRADGATLLVDAGFGPRTLVRRAEEAGIPLTPLVGVALTHEHGDHARGAAQVAKSHACPVFSSQGTLARLTARAAVRGIPLTPHRDRRVGPFKLEAAHTSHDASEPVALAVTGPGGEKVGIAHDLGRPTAAVRYLLRDCTVLILEANHDEMLLRTGPYPAAVRQRISGSGGHLSNRAAAELAAELCHPNLDAVVLVHLSERCNREELAREAVASALNARGFRGRLLVAAQDRALAALALPEAGQLSLSLAEPRSPPSPATGSAPTPASSA